MSRNILTGLVGAWCPSLGPSGYTLLDRSGRGNHGTLTNMDAGAWKGNPGGWALDFDGTNDFAGIGSPSSLSGAFPQMSKAIWVKPAQTAVQKYIFADFNNSGTTSRLSLSNDTKLKAFQNTATLLTSTTTVSTGVWYHVVVTRNDGTGASNTGVMNLYINGVLEATTTYSYTSPSLQISGEQIGRSNSFYGDYYAGAADDAAIWNRAITAGEVRQLYQLGRGGLGRLLTQRAQQRVFRTAQGNRRRRLICGAEC